MIEITLGKEIQAQQKIKRSCCWCKAVVKSEVMKCLTNRLYAEKE